MTSSLGYGRGRFRKVQYLKKNRSKGLNVWKHKKIHLKVYTLLRILFDVNAGLGTNNKVKCYAV